MLPEVQTYVERLQNRRVEILQVLEGLNAEALNWKPLPQDTNSLAVLATHALGSERMWIHQVIGRVTIDRNRDAEFKAQAEDLDTLKDRYVTVANQTDQVLGALTADDLSVLRTNGRYTESVRWCILHVIEHYSEHLAQMWLTRQLWENQSKTSRP